MRRKRKRRNPAVIVVLLIILVGAAGAVSWYVDRHTPTTEMMDLTEYYGSAGEGQAVLILNETILDSRAVLGNPSAELAEWNLYLPLNAVAEHLNQRYYYDAENNQILYATPSELTTASVSDQAGTDAWNRDGTIYLSLAYVHRFTDLDILFSTDPDRVAIRSRFENVNTVTSMGETAVRKLGGIKSPILTYVPYGENMVLLSELDNWYQVATRSGCIGYVEKRDTSDPFTATEERAPVVSAYTYNTLDHKVNLTWHQIFVQEANSYFADMTAYMGGVNVISPTWFSMKDNAGNISNLSSTEYVAQAHAKGLQVWAMVDNHSTEISSFEILSHTSSRQNLVRNLISAALGAGVDGINIDFELLSEETGEHFLEFLRELSIETHKNGLILSVDNTVPQEYTSHYDRAEQGKVADYIIIMGYDEHHESSETAGSVASLPWVEKGVQETILEVEPSRTILAVPFYTRLWKTQNGRVTSEAIGMNKASELAAQNNAQIYWDVNLCQNVASYEKDGISYQIWMEDNQSIAEKVKLIPRYALGGIASWSLGFEDSSIWSTILDNLQG